MAKKTTTARKNATAAAVAVALDWNAEVASMEAAAKEKGERSPSRGDALGRVAKFIAGDDAAALLLREAAGEAGAQTFIDAPRNVLAKLPKLARCLAAGQPWCSRAGLDPSATRKEDASVAVALGSLGAGDDRQKAIIASALKRYPGGANAQMPAALDACAIMGIVERKPGGPRSCEYAIVDAARANSLIPQG